MSIDVKQDVSNSICVVDSNTGEVIKSDKVYVFDRPKEPFSNKAFVKMFIEDISSMYKLTGVQHKLMCELSVRMGYDNTVLVPTKIRADIAKIINAKDMSVKNAMTALIKKGFVIKVATSIFKVNPHYYGKGSWKNVKKITMTWDVDNHSRVVEIMRDCRTDKKVNNNLK